MTAPNNALSRMPTNLRSRMSVILPRSHPLDYLSSTRVYHVQYGAVNGGIVLFSTYRLPLKGGTGGQASSCEKKIGVRYRSQASTL
jgi:hypothetical protein